MKSEPRENWSTVRGRKGGAVYRRRDGVWEFLGGVIEYDPQWRSRNLLAAFEASQIGKKLSPAQIAALRAVETSIEFICGKPGGGKSMYATKLIIDELCYGFRPIVTNLALNIARLQEYLDELGFHVHVADRVLLLTKEEVPEFYYRRGHLVTLSPPVEGSRFVDWIPSQEHESSAGGVMYVLDECHNYFHPLAFGKERLTPEHPLMQYATQHRKLKDNCYLVTQSVENVHVAVRRLGQQFSYIRNNRKETFKGFRRGEGFTRTVYLTPPTSEAAVPIDGDSFRLDVRGLASCYYTAGGVGIAAVGTGDGGAKKKGLNLNWIYAFGAAALIGVGCVLWFGVRWSTNALLGSTVARRAGSLPSKVVASAAMKADTPKVAVADVADRRYFRGIVLDGDKLRVAVDGEWVFVASKCNDGALVLVDGRQVYEEPEAVREKRKKAASSSPVAMVGQTQ